MADMECDSKWIICRICLKSDKSDMNKIFGDDSSLAPKIEECGGISVKAGDDLPEWICNKCMILLKAATKFRRLCERSEEYLTPFGTKDSPKVSAKEQIKIELSSGNATTTRTTAEIIPAEEISADYSTEDQMYNEDYLVEPEDPLTADTNEAQFEVLNQTKNIYNENDMEDLELVLDLNGDQTTSTFKIVSQPKASAAPVASSTQKLKPLAVNKKRTRRSLEMYKTADGTYSCPYCDNSYALKTKLSLHLRIHTNEKPHQCEICLKRFGQTPQLARHMNSHTGSKPFQCKFCPASFADPSTRIKHERIHTKERPYKCDVCSKTFAYSNVLKIHKFIHTGEKPYVCRFCGRQFSQSHHRKNHEQLHAVGKLFKYEEDEEEAEDA